MPLRTVGLAALTLALTLLASPASALACPGDGGPAPQSIKDHFCGAWNGAEARGINLGSPLNDAHRWGPGWTRDFDGGAFGRGAIMEGDGVNFAYIVGQPWWNAYVAAGGGPGDLRYPVGRADFGGHIGNGPRANQYMTFQGGVMNAWAAGVFATWGAILAKWNQLGNVTGGVGRPLSTEAPTARVAGRFSRFEGGNIYYNQRLDGAYHVYGGILNKYLALGYSNHPLGLPTSDRRRNPGRGNEYQTFDGGVINQYGGNAYETHGAILAKWRALGGPNGPVGLPTSDEHQTARVNGRYATFQGGNLIYNPRSGDTWHVYGGILNKYRRLGHSAHPLGLPTGDRKRNRARGNDYQTFQGGVINQYGGNAYETHGAVLDRWQRSGGPGGSLGLPTSDEHATPRSPQGTVGRYSRFERGLINYNPRTNRAYVLFGSIGRKYASMGYARSYLGLPTSEEFDRGAGKRQNFEGGYIDYVVGEGAHANRDARPGAEGPFIVRVLGDSVPAGFGLQSNPEQNYECAGRMPTTRCDSPFGGYGAMVARALDRSNATGGRPVNFNNLAVAGSRPYDWLVGDDTRGGKADMPDLRGRFNLVTNARPDVIIVTLGANDLLADRGCAAVPTCASSATRDTEIQMRLLLRRLRDRTDASIYVTHYYRVVHDHSGATEFLNKALDRAVGGLGRRVSIVGLPSFDAHQCGSDDSWMLGYGVDGCFHPNSQGHRQIADSVLRAIRR